MAKKIEKDMSKISLDAWGFNPDENNTESTNNKEEETNNASSTKSHSIVKDHLEKNKNISKKRLVEDDADQLPKKLQFLEKDVQGNVFKQLVVTDENHKKIRYAAQLCGVEIQQLTNNVFEHFFTTFKKELNQVRDNKISF